MTIIFGVKSLTIVVGCGRLGRSIATYSSQSGGNVAVVDHNKESLEKLQDFPGIKINADATDIDDLKEIGIENAKEIIITTGDDNANLFLAKVAAEIYKVPYIYVRFDDPNKGLLIQGLPVSAIYPFQLSLDKLNIMRLGVEQK